MKIIISPAKQMKPVDLNLKMSAPVFLDKTNELVHHIQNLNYESLKNHLKCSDSLALQTYELYQTFGQQETSPALLTYAGIQYQYMHAQIFDDQELSFLQDHLYILSALYGLLKPLDEIRCYRLEMQAKIPFRLYDFWKDNLANEIKDPIILNLASEEYAKCIRKYKKLIDVRFVEKHKEKYVEKGVYAKMARGAMVRFIAVNQIENIEKIKEFNEFDYTYAPEMSNECLYVFKRN